MEYICWDDCSRGCIFDRICCSGCSRHGGGQLARLSHVLLTASSTNGNRTTGNVHHSSRPACQIPSYSCLHLLSLIFARFGISAYFCTCLHVLIQLNSFALILTCLWSLQIFRRVRRSNANRT
ncbi:hypothetical protein M405DRAFT_499048 [Rhizopogon salebrosus TDB-379]|nr:hypothetical protein M405DRAFT_499048 [Rhizopogon salebrosus TDB-379]